MAAIRRRARNRSVKIAIRFGAIGCCEILELLAATSNTLRGAETFANDTIVVADFASAIPFGNFRRAPVCGAGHPSSALAVAAVDLFGATALGGRSGWASSGSSSLRRKAVGRSGTDNTRSAAAPGRSAEVGAWRASVRRSAIVRRREACMHVLPRPENQWCQRWPNNHGA